MKELLKDLYDFFYTPPELSAERQEVEECHQALIKALEKPERRLVPRIIDAKDHIIADTFIDSFILIPNRNYQIFPAKFAPYGVAALARATARAADGALSGANLSRKSFGTFYQGLVLSLDSGRHGSFPRN